MATITNKNSMLPTYQGNYKDMVGALRAGDISSPCWFWIEDRSTLSFIHWEKNEQNEKVLVPHLILWDKVVDIENRLNEATEGLINPETGEVQSVTTYVTNNIAPVQEQVTVVNETVADIQRNGAAILITSKDLGGGE